MLPRNHASWFWDKENHLNANGISQMFIMTLLTEHEGGFPIAGWDWVYNRHQSIREADRRRFPSRKHFKGRMAAKGVFSPLSSSLPVWLLQQAKSMATHGRRTHQQWRTHQRRTHHFANASTPSLRRKGRNTGDWIKYKQLNYCFVAEKCVQRFQKVCQLFHPS